MPLWRSVRPTGRVSSASVDRAETFDVEVRDVVERSVEVLDEPRVGFGPVTVTVAVSVAAGSGASVEHASRRRAAVKAAETERVLSMRKIIIHRTDSYFIGS